MTESRLRNKSLSIHLHYDGIHLKGTALELRCLYTLFANTTTTLYAYRLSLSCMRLISEFYWYLNKSYFHYQDIPVNKCTKIWILRDWSVGRRIQVEIALDYAISVNNFVSIFKCNTEIVDLSVHSAVLFFCSRPFFSVYAAADVTGKIWPASA